MRAHFFSIRTIDCFSQAMKKSVADGTNQLHRKVNIFTMDEERQILARLMHQINTPHGLANRFGFYYCGVFLIRSQTEFFGIQLGMFNKVSYNGRTCITSIFYSLFFIFHYLFCVENSSFPSCPSFFDFNVIIVLLWFF